MTKNRPSKIHRQVRLAGFAYTYYLSRVFRDVTGQTWTAFRRQVRNLIGVGGARPA